MNQINLETIDVKLLKKQKRALVTMATKLALDNDKYAVSILDGVINLLDYIQDAIELESITFDILYKARIMDMKTGKLIPRNKKTEDS